nr:outer membrane protein assembly factor BamA [Bacteroidota bacterium]
MRKSPISKPYTIVTQYLTGLLFLIVFLTPAGVKSQVSVGDKLLDIDYTQPREYEIGGITVSGVKYLDEGVLVMISGLAVGQKIKIPGDRFRDAISKLWDQGLFEYIGISVTEVQDDIIFFNIDLRERPRLSKFSFTGVKKAEADNLREDILLVRGDVVTDNLLTNTRNRILNYFSDKGYLNAEVDIEQIPDTASSNNVILKIKIDKNTRIRIYSIQLKGNHHLTEQQALRTFKNTKEKGVFKPFNNLEGLIWTSIKTAFQLQFDTLVTNVNHYLNENIKIRIFKSSKYIEDEWDEDKIALIDKYNAMGFRDAEIVSDSVYRHNEKSININVTVDEGSRYYFGDITWIGNTKYTDEFLNAILKIQKGDIYNLEMLTTNLSFNPNGYDVSSLYLDDGYLFFQANPVEVRVENDTIDLEIRIREGKQARINKVTVKGNTKTNDRVIIREIRTRPGQLFSRSDIIRTTRELAQLRYFDPETISPDVRPNPADGTVDIIYSVEETSADQVELSGGWGYGRIIGTLGLSFNNFSLRNIFKAEAWRPI